MLDVPVLKPDFSAVRGKRLLVALSGGADSVALLTLLAREREAFSLSLEAAHLDHGIRPESDQDAEFCRDLCRRLDVPFHTTRLDVPAEAAKRHRGIEAVARELRYEWLREIQRETASDFIVLAHHMDDQAETVLMHLARGAGPNGICAMRELSDGLYRPLLRYRKSQLQDFLVRNGFGWREDATNGLDDNPRNALRLHVLPELEKSYPRFAEAAARYAYSAQIESDCLEALANDYLAAHRSGNGFCEWLDLTNPPPRAILRRAIMAVCAKASPSWETLNALEALCASPRGKIDLSADYFAERTGGRLYFVPKSQRSIAPVALSLSGETDFSPICRILAMPCAPVPIRDDPMRQALNAAALKGAVVRTRLPGDRIRPLGCGDRLLSDYLTDRKVDRPLRDSIALIAVGNRVHWVCGLGISQEAAIGPGDEAVRLECVYKTNANTGG